MKFAIPMNQADIIVLSVLSVFFILGIRIVIGFFKVESVPRKASSVNAATGGPCKVTLTIDGMMCGMCETHVKQAIRSAVPSARHITANHTKGIAAFMLNSTTSISEINEGLSNAMNPLGYRIESIQIKDSKDKNN